MDARPVTNPMSPAKNPATASSSRSTGVTSDKRTRVRFDGTAEVRGGQPSVGGLASSRRNMSAIFTARSPPSALATNTANARSPVYP